MIFFLLSAAGPLGIFLRFPSCLWNFDGVACAIALELGNPVFFFHSNHLLYGFLGYGFWRALEFFFDSLRALPALQLLSSLLSALGLAGLCRLLFDQTREPAVALGLTWALSVTAAFWVWSLEAQVYPLGFAALAWAAYVLLAGDSSPKKYRWVGFLHGLAVLGHMMHVLWIAPALYWIYAGSRPIDESYARIRAYLSVLGLTVVIPYLSVFFFVLLPSRRGFPWLLTWLKGSAGLTPDRHFAWHLAGGWKAPFQWAWGNLPFGWGAFSPYRTQPVDPLGWMLTIVSIGLFGWGLFLSFRNRSELWKFSLIWLGAYALFLWTWEPRTLCYRMADIVPLAILLSLGAARMGKTFRNIWLILLLGTTLAANFGTLIGSLRRAESNAVYRETLALSKETPPHALYLTGGGDTWIYLLYFGGRSAWNVHLLPSQRLTDGVARHKQSHPVYAQTSLLRDPALQSWMERHKFRPVAPDLPWVQLL